MDDEAHYRVVHASLPLIAFIDTCRSLSVPTVAFSCLLSPRVGASASSGCARVAHGLLTLPVSNRLNRPQNASSKATGLYVLLDGN
ncbi:hypothetical protein ACLOJK_040164 [Asimina triloba]